jgi:hypothetical protein
MMNFLSVAIIGLLVALYMADFLGLIANLLIFAMGAEPGKKTLLRIVPLGEESDIRGWLINFSVENFTESDISIAPIVTATFKTGAGDNDIAFIISSPYTTIPANGKKTFSASAHNQNAKTISSYSLHQVHVTAL